MSNLFRKEIYVRVCVTVVCAAIILIIMPGCPPKYCNGVTVACPIWPWDTNCHWDGDSRCTGCQDNSALWSTRGGTYKSCIYEDGEPATGCSPDCVCLGCGKYGITFTSHCPTTAYDADDCEGSCTYAEYDICNLPEGEGRK